MAFEHLTAKDIVEKTAPPSSLKIDFCLADSQLLARLKGDTASDQTSKLLPSLKIADDAPDSKKIAPAELSKTNDDSRSGETFDIITGAGSRSQLFHTKPQERHHVTIPPASPEVVPADPNAPAIEVIPYSGTGSRAHLFSGRPALKPESGK